MDRKLVEKSEELFSQATHLWAIYLPEITVIMEAANYIAAETTRDDIFIFSYNQVAIKSLGSVTAILKIVRAHHRSLKEMAKQKRLSPIWVGFLVTET